MIEDLAFTLFLLKNSPGEYLSNLFIKLFGVHILLVRVGLNLNVLHDILDVRISPGTVDI